MKKETFYNGLKEPCMIRYTILECRFFRIAIHKFITADSERPMHDHPCNMWSFIFKGSYTEEYKESQNGITITRAKTFTAPTIRRIPAEHIHRIIHTEPAWSIIFSTPSFREWGFHTEKQGWVQWEQFYGER
jgi:hypothetical protein